jgi:hypothetical protein
MSIGWKFAKGTQLYGGNDGAIDTFAGTRVHSMVREIIQNSLDARDKTQNEPVRVSFSLSEIARSEIHGLGDLDDHLKACEVMAGDKQKLDKLAKFYSSARKRIKQKKVKVLCVSDFNTTGLTGSIHLIDASGQWLALTKGVGLTQKPGGSNGSFGHGSMAPFLMTPLRSLFYLTETTNPNGKRETRFQGKSILQSHIIDDELLDGTGYYSAIESELPLIDNDVPAWASKLRAADGQGRGTSILIPFTDFDTGLFPETLITVIANFYYVFKLGKLEVVVNGETISQKNCDEKFIQAKQQLPFEQDGIDVTLTKERLKTIDTILDADHNDSQQIPGFGRVDWFMRVGRDDIAGRSVSIARESGMFITNKAPHLQRFSGKKNFDMFVYVTPGDGSNLLRELENPEHDNFEFDRINDKTDRSKIKKSYEKFSDKIREIIERFATVEQLEETVVRDFDEIYSRSVSSGVNDQGSERGNKMFISQINNSKYRGANPGAGGRAGTIPVPGGETNSGKGKKQSNAGNTIGGGEPGKADTGVGDLNTIRSAIQAERLRINRLSRGNLQVHFNCYKEGDFQFQLFKVGEGGMTTPLIMKADGKECSLINIKIPNGTVRSTMSVELKTESDSFFAMEAWLNEIK